MRDSTHEDYAADAEAAQSNSAWLQAAALWRKAAECCPDADQAGRYASEAERCVQEFSVDQQLATIARRVLTNQKRVDSTRTPSAGSILASSTYSTSPPLRPWRLSSSRR